MFSVVYYKKRTIPEPLTTLALILIVVMLSGKGQCQLNQLNRPNFRFLLDFKDYESSEEEEEECRVGGNFCQNGGTCIKLSPEDVRGLSSSSPSNEMIYRLQMVALSSTENERQRLLGFRCKCTSGFEGEFCQTRTWSSLIVLPHVQMICIIVGVIICLVAMIICAVIIYCNRSRLKRNDEWGLVKTPTGELEKVRLHHCTMDGQTYVMLDQKEADTSAAAAAAAATEDEDEHEDEREQSAAEEDASAQQPGASSSVNENQKPETVVDEVATPRSSQPSDLGNSPTSELRYNTATRASHQFDSEEKEKPQIETDAPGQVFSSSTLNSGIAAYETEELFTPANPTPSGDGWNNELVYNEPIFYSQSVPNINRPDDANEEGNANPLGLGFAYSFVDDPFRGPDPLIYDTGPHANQHQLHYDGNNTNFAETNSHFNPNAQPVEIAQQHDNHPGYYNPGSPQPTQVSEKPQLHRNAHPTQSPEHLHHNAQPINANSPFNQTSQSTPVTELSELSGLAQPTQRHQIINIDEHIEQTPPSKAHVHFYPYEGVQFAQTSKNPHIFPDVYQEQAHENSNYQRNVYPYENQTKRQTYQSAEELENSQLSEHVKPAQYSEKSQFYNGTEEATEDDQSNQHRPLSTIFESEYTNENIRPIYNYETSPMSYNAQQIAATPEQNEYVENKKVHHKPEQNEYVEKEQLHQEPQAIDAPENSQSSQNVNQFQITDSLEIYKMQLLNNSEDPQFHENWQPTETDEDTPVISGERADLERNAGHEGSWKGLASRSLESTVLRIGFDREPSAQSSRNSSTPLTRSATILLQPRKSISYTSESSPTILNQSSNSNRLLKEQLGFQKSRPAVYPPLQPTNQLVSGVAGAFLSFTDGNPSFENQNQSNIADVRSESENVDMNAPLLPKTISPKTVVPDVKGALPTVTRQAKKVEKNKSDRNKIKSRSNQKTLYNEKPKKPNKKKEVSSFKSTPKRSNVKPQQKRKPNATPQSNNATPKSNNATPKSKNATPKSKNATPKSNNATPKSNNAKRVVDKASDQKTLDHRELPPPATNQSTKAVNGRGSEMMKIKKETLLSNYDDKNGLKLTQQGLGNGCPDKLKSEKEKAKEQLSENATAQQQLLERAQNERQLLDKAQNQQTPLEIAEKEQELCEKPQKEQRLHEKAQQEQQLLHKAEKEQQLVEKSQELLDNTYNKQKSLENERKEQHRIEKAHKEHQVREKARKDQLRFQKTQQKQLQLQIQKTLGKEQLSSVKTQGEQLHFENAQQEHRRCESVQKERLKYGTGEKEHINFDAQTEHQIFKNAQNENLPYEKTQRKQQPRQQQQLLENAHEKELGLLFENAHKEQLRFKKSQKERLRFEDAQKPRVRFDDSQMSHQRFQETQREEQLLEKANEEEGRFEDPRREQLRCEHSLNERLVFENSQKEHPWFKNGQNGHSRVDNSQIKDPWPQNGQREHLRFDNLKKKFPWPENGQREHLLFDSLQKKDLCFKNGEKEHSQNERVIRFEHAQKGQHEQEQQLEKTEGQPFGLRVSSAESIQNDLRERQSRDHPQNHHYHHLHHHQQQHQQQQHVLWTKSTSSLSVRLPRDVSSSSSRHRSYSDVALALKNSLENLTNARSSVFRQRTRFGYGHVYSDSSEWDTIAERTAESDLELEQPLVPSGSSSEKVSLKKNGTCEPTRGPAVRVGDGTRDRLSEPISTAKKAWSKRESRSSDITTALMDELKAYLTRYRLRVANSSDEVLNGKN